MTAHNFKEINFLNKINKCDVICLSESYLDSSINNLNIKGYKINRAYKSNNVTRGGVCAYIKKSLHVRCLINTHLQECLILEITINSKKGYVISLYRSSSQISIC